MNNNDRDFFILLQAGLGLETGERLSDNPDWGYIYTLAREQAVLGIICASWGRFSAGEKCQERTVPELAAIIRRNVAVNDLQKRVTGLLTDNNIKHHIVKGQEAAKNYPNPLLRMSGDIDILLPPDDYERAKPLLKEISDSEEPEQPERLHKGYLINGIDIELHGTLHPLLGQRVNRVLDSAQRDLFDRTITLHTFHHLCLFVHALQHFCHGGLGIRQIVDWQMNHIRHKEDIDYAYVDTRIRQMHLTREWHNFLTFAHELTTSTSLSPVSQIIWEECKLRGNMGHNTRFLKRKGSFLHRNTRTLLSLFTRFHRNRHVIPTARFPELRKDIVYYASLFGK